MTRIRIILFVLLLAAAGTALGIQAYAAKAVHNASLSVECDGNMTTADRMHCENLRLDKADERLNKAYKTLMGAFDSKMRAKLLESQRAWLKFRDLNFDFFSSVSSKEGREGLLLHVRAMRLFTESRVRELEGLIKPDSKKPQKPKKSAKPAHATKAEKFPDLHKTVFYDKGAKARLMGRHPLRLQWLNEDPTGEAVVTEREGTLFITGTQRAGEDYLGIDGWIKAVRTNSFVFSGTVTTRVGYLNQGRPCERSGRMVFVVKGQRPFWRMRGIQSPCADVVDYIDVFFRGWKPKKKKR
ncbi:MAG: lysozyme inhibitor LprI family protein [Thermodesulfobacteriota bacterium]|nr:lysozyme inhibitor LprI family protein [Thermodesulfobacteriota bacterium]